MQKSINSKWVSRWAEFNGKVSQGIGFVLHNIIMLIKLELSLAWVSIMVRLNLSFNKFKGSLVLKSGRAIHFCFWIKHQVQEQVWGRSLGNFRHIHSRSPTASAQHRTNQHAKGQDELVLARFGQPILLPFILHRDGLRTITLTLPNLWV